MSATPNRAADESSASMTLLLLASCGGALSVLDTNVVGVILPTIAQRLHASFADIEWVVSAYVLMFASLLLPAGALADRFGRKRVFLGGVSAFGLASLGCALAPTASALYLARAAQGIGSAFMIAPSLALIGHAFHSESGRARAWAIWGGIMGLFMVLAPLIGGIVSRLLGWRWAFGINVPICALLLILSGWRIAESRDPHPRPLDFPGIALFIAAMFSLTWALILGPGRGWASLDVAIRLAASLALFAAFSWNERHREHPMLDLKLFTSFPFFGAVVAMFAYAGAAQVMASLLPLYLQNVRGLAPLMAGIAMLPFALAMLLLPHAGRRLGKRFNSHQILILGLLLTGLGNALMIWASLDRRLGVLIPAMAILGSGGGLMNGETQKAIMSTVPRHRAGMASGISTTARFSGILIGFSGLGAILASGVQNALTQAPDAHFVARVIAGDIDNAVGAYAPAMQDALRAGAHQAYGQGFAHAFLASSALAFAATLVVWLSIRGVNSSALISEGEALPAIE